jgi:hypothetical protein
VEDKTSDVFAAHTLIGADSLHAYAAFRTFEMEDVSEFAAGVSAGDTIHCRKGSLSLRGFLYQ